MEEDKDIELDQLDVQEADAVQKNLAGIIDALIVLVLYTAPSFLFPDSLLSGFISRVYIPIGLFVVFALYRLIGLLVTKSTVGMRVARIRLLNGRLQNLNIFESFCAAFFILIRGTRYYDRRIFNMN
jgi:uncharacterized RDD family membrane protein YckC